MSARTMSFLWRCQSCKTCNAADKPIQMKNIGENIGDQMMHSNKAKSDQWFQFCARKVIKSAVHQKFLQNPSLHNQSLQLNATFAETNQHDSHWGISSVKHNDD